MSLFALRGFTWRSVAFIVSETPVIIGAFYLAAYLRVGREIFLLDSLSLKALLIAVVAQVCLYFADLYDLRIISDRRELFVRGVQAFGATCLVLAGIYFWLPDLSAGRGIVLVATFPIIGLLFSWRFAFEWTTRHVVSRERLLLVGTSDSAVRLARELYGRCDHGLDIVGFIDPDRSCVGKPVINPGVIGTVEDIPAIVRARAVDQVVVSLSDARGMLPMDKLLEMKLDGVSFTHLASVYERYTGKIALENLRPSWLIFSDGFQKSNVQRRAKRALDIIMATVGLVIALPLLVVVAAAIKMTSAGPVLYRQPRVGLRGQIFTIHKFRSMRHDAERDTGAVWARRDDQRVTTFGRWLRRTRLDELPQLWNVIRGDMSMVGPRPERPEFVSDLTRDITFYGLRHVIRPGITGWAQVQYTYGASVEDAMEKLQYDLFYIKNRSIALDLFIIAKTVKTVLTARGAQ
jgi:sugar transferase (PEP-CTERM system associated)